MVRKWVLASAISLALSPPGVAALGLGELRTDSALNEPFVAEIALIDVKPDELDTVKASLAPDAEFEKVGAERFFYLTKLRFSPQISPQGRPILRVTSREPIREPFLDFLVEVNWPAGRLVREYTVLLDPPTTRDRRARRQIRDAVVAAPHEQAPGPSAMTARAPMPAQVPSAVRTSDFPLRTDPVPPGSGLLRMARRLAPPAATVPQTTLALYRNNPSAFIGGDINQLRVGETLSIPSAEELFALDAQTARRSLAAALRGEAVASAPLAPATQAPAQPPGGPDAGRLRIAAAPPQDGAPEATPGRDGETVGAGGGGDAATAEELMLLREASESTRQETRELRGRVRELEAQLADIRDLLALRNEQLAELQLAQALEAEAQSDAEPEGTAADLAGRGEPAAEPEERPEPAGVDEREAAAEVDIAAGDSDAVEDGMEPPALQPQPEPEVPDVSIAVTEPEADDASAGPSEVVPAAEAELDEPQPELAGAAEPQATPQPETAAQADQAAAAESQPGEDEPQTAQPQEDATTAQAEGEVATPRPDTEPGPGEQVAADEESGSIWPWVAIGAGLAALLGALGWYLSRRRQRLAASLRADRGLASPQSPDAERPETGPPAAPSMRQRAETPESEAPITATDSEVRPFDSETEVDVFSEADIYIAYGRYREAEALLKEEIHRDPQRLDLQLKLAEALFGMKQYEAFEGLLEQLRSAGVEREHSEHWRRLLTMQASLQERPAAAGGQSVGGTGTDTDEDLLGESFTEPAAEQAPSEPARVDEGRATGQGGATETSYLEMDLDLDTLTTSGSSGATADLEQVPQRREFRQEGGQEDDLASEFDLDLGELGLRRPSSEGAGEPGGLEEPPAASESPSDPFGLRSDAGGGDDLASSSWQQDSGLWDEVATKLDLARAYLEMRDGDAARVILEEVAEEGNDAQRSEAKQLLEQLD